jgi:DHA1 family multidrug resistance protein-like MFS transporter
VSGSTTFRGVAFPLNRELTLLFLVSFLMSLGMNLTNALWPLYVQSLGATVLQVSLLVSITGLIGTVLRAPSGFASDVYDRRKIILASTVLAVAPPILYTLSAHWEQLIPWGIVYALAFALYMPSRMAIVADYTTPANRLRVYSIMNLAWPLGSIVGPTIGGVLENLYGWAAIFYLATGLYLCCVVPSVLLLRSRVERDAPATPRRAVRLDRATLRPLTVFFLVNLFTGMGMGTVSPITPIYLTEKFAVSTAEVGVFISIGFGLTALVTQVPAGILAERVGRRRFIAVCLSLMPVLFVVWTWIDHLVLLLAVQMAINALWSMTWPAFSSLLMERVPRTQRGVSSGVVQTGIMLGFTAGPALGGYLWEGAGAAWPYYASAAFLALCVPILPFIREHEG